MDYKRKIPAGVYGILDTVTDEIIYIGESKKPYRRNLYHFQKTKPHMDSTVRGYMRSMGFDQFNFFLIEEVPDKDKRYKLEQQLIGRLQPIGNVRDY